MSGGAEMTIHTWRLITCFYVYGMLNSRGYAPIQLLIRKSRQPFLS
jgi:hypothetical protein